MENVTKETFIDAPPDDVWDAITDPDELSEWFGAAVDGEIAEGELVRFAWPDGAGRRAVIERIDEGRQLTFRWLGSDDDPASRVDITVEPVDEGSVISITEWRIEPAVSHTRRIGFEALAA
ncbi:MAG: SRPBCC domain-containing protein [Actinomycetota bacterium]